MPTNTPDQGIPIQNGADPANLPGAQTSEVGTVEPRLVRTYTNLADRTARALTLQENNVSGLAAEDRLEVYDGANWVSAYTRTLWSATQVTVDQVVSNSTTLTNITQLVAPLPTAGTFQWQMTLFYDSSATEDIALAFTWPAAVTTPRWGALMLDTTAAAGIGSIKATTQTVSGTSLSYGGGGVGTIQVGTVWGRLTMGGTAGNLQPQFAQAAAAATNTTIRIGSWLHVWRIL